MDKYKDLADEAFEKKEGRKSYKEQANETFGGGDWDESKHPRDDEGKFVSVSEFRYLEKHPDPKMKHPAHLYARNDKDAKYIQLTHSEKIKDNPNPNIKMVHNPNPNDKRDSYFVPKSETAKIADLGKAKKKWNLSDEDDKNMKPYRDEPFNKKK